MSNPVQVKVAWNMNSRRKSQVNCWFNTLNNVTETAIIEWMVGQPLQSQIYQMSMAREDFSY